MHRWICVMAQHEAERAIKAVLVERAIEFPRTHDVSRLLTLLPEGLLAEPDAEDLDRLSAWAVAGRYPADLRDAMRDDADGAVAIARTIVTDVKGVLDPGSDVGSARDRA